MDKRQFLKTTGALITGGVLAQLLEGAETATRRTNWAGNYEFRATDLLAPQQADEVPSIVKKATRLKALGARHSFNAIADSQGDQISLQHLDEMHLNPNTRSVTIGAGVRYGTLAPYLDQNGFAVHNLASLPHVTVAGACATATHGSGIRNGNLSTAVSALELITGTGEVVKVQRDDGDRFHGTVVGLGACGVITRVTLEVLPTFRVAQVVYQNLPLSHLEAHLDEIFSSGYSVSLFTDWQGHRATQAWIKRRVSPGSSPDFPDEFFGAVRAKTNLHPLAGHSAENCTEQMGVPGPWYERLPHFRMNFTPSSGAELQSEYFVPRERGYPAILAVERLRDRITPHLFITELRTIAADELWMSPCYRRDSLTIHFTWKPEWESVKQVLPQIEEVLAPFDARPHWAKLFTMEPRKLQSLYPRLPDFRALLKEYDPHGKFRNDFLNTNIYG